MAKVKIVFVCQECGNESPRWMGQCPSCKAWNSFVEETPLPVTRSRGALSKIDKPYGGKPIRLDEVGSELESRMPTGVPEIDRVLGGGVVRGSAILVAGDPGIGKSTLMTELGLYLKNHSILYIAGEESPGQIKMRAERIGVSGDHMRLLPETNVESIIHTVLDDQPEILIVDSVQTLFSSDVQSAPGSVAQVRESAAALIQLAKISNIAVFFVGHVTKDGAIAGPRVLEHMVDTVLYLEGDRHHAYRILRAVKNRFGSTNEIGVFEMTATGLSPVKNPSRIFLSDRQVESPGSVVVCSVEGTRPILAEIQALVVPTSYATSQRTTTGYDGRRLQMLLAVMEKRSGMKLSGNDVFLNVAGGLRLSEPAIDLGIVAAIASSFRDIPVDRGTVHIGEVGLSGEVRAVSHLEPRLKESANLGFNRALIPSLGSEEKLRVDGIEVQELDSIKDLMESIF
ncbi:MAG: DNA repair protein RadA [Bacteroidetes bacterium]|nr:MAG: DNA repair protein RadA [Bacteroidota bacterium]